MYAIAVSGDYIGKHTKQFESGSKGSLALSQCGNDMGLSCGSYQLTLAWGNCIRFLQKYFPDLAKDLYYKKYLKTPKWPGADYCSSPDDVKKVWKAAYDSVGADKFFEYEHAYIQAAYYEPFMQKLKGILNPNTACRALQDCCWSWSVHRGSSGAWKEFQMLPKEVLSTDNMEELLDAIYDVRYSTFKYNRYKKGISAGSSEREKLRAFCNVNPLPYDGTNPSEEKPVEQPKEEKPVEQPLFRVQTGAFSKKENADALVKKLKTAGFDTYMVMVDNMYKVQTGAFSKKENADALVKKLKTAGFEAFITTKSGTAVPTVDNTTKVKTFKVGDILYYSKDVHYVSAYSKTPLECIGGLVKVTQVHSDGLHKYHVVGISKYSTVHGWVDAEFLSERELEIGDTVIFTGTTHFISSSSPLSKSCQPGFAKITSKNLDGSHPYHLVALSTGTSTVHGWTNLEDILEDCYKVGDIVYVKNLTYYPNSSSTKALLGKHGKAKIVSIDKNCKHPYCLQGIGNSISGYYNPADFI